MTYAHRAITALLIVVVAWLIDDRLSLRRDFKRLERFCLTSFTPRNKPRNNRPPVWVSGSIKTDTPYETIYANLTAHAAKAGTR